MSRLLNGRYELVDRIGEGGMAVVYKAKDRLLNRFVAVKILRPEFTKDAQFIENFRRESQAAAGLQHPNIIAVYDVGHEGNIYFIVMELVDGISLSDYIKKKAPMDYREVVRITKQVAQALSVAHHHNIIHRDIKPHNVMLTPDGTAKLGDFGIAKAISNTTLADTDTIIGSVHYFSPEQARGSYVDELSDIYSLGIIMYEMLTGKVPFDGDNPVQIALMHINNDITPPSQLVSGIPPSVEKIVMKAAARFQSERYKNVDLMIEDLNNVEYVSGIMGSDYSAAGESKTKSDSMEPAEAEGDDAEDRRNSRRLSERDRKPNRKRILIIALLIIAALGITAFALSKSSLFSGPAVPNVVGETYEEAKSDLEAAGFTVTQGDSIPSDTVAEGSVAKQSPAGGKHAKKGSEVKLYLSSGKRSEKIPNLVGKYYDKSEIIDILNANGYELGDVTEEESDKYQKGYIISQSPSAGSKKTEGTKVDIVVSKGSSEQQQVTVPTLAGSTYNHDTAKQTLEDVGLSLGSVSYQYSDSYSKGQIISQSPSAGSSVNKGTSVNLIVSNGPDPSSNNNSNNKGNSGDSGNTGTDDDPAEIPSTSDDSGN
ncbi:MAG: Stk1 family PASTA domain-containing Ser/Thr kinase [Eubacteriales bacterium]|nr:Stk1 family PASTA domain-containing Ser/Thr kinase [Eubacteriales bacterium]